jgi:hypothetical protein
LVRTLETALPIAQEVHDTFISWIIEVLERAR